MSSRPSLLNHIRWILEFIPTVLIMTVARWFSMHRTVPFFQKLFTTLGPYTKSHQRIERNLERAYLDMPLSQRNDIAKGAWANFANVMVDFLYIQSLQKELSQHPDRLCVQGQHILDAVRQSGKGAIFFSAHMATWEIARIAAFQKDVPLGMLYRAFNNPYIDRYLRTFLKMGDTPFFHKGIIGTRKMMKYLKGGGSILILVDQKLSEGRDVPFMNLPSKTATAAPEIALKMNIPFIPVIVKRNGLGRFQVIFEPPLDLEKARQTPDPVLTLGVAMNTCIERWITERPHEWFWLHNRWKA